jgi:hypothetical protein
MELGGHLLRKLIFYVVSKFLYTVSQKLRKLRISCFFFVKCHNCPICFLISMLLCECYNCCRHGDVETCIYVCNIQCILTSDRYNFSAKNLRYIKLKYQWLKFDILVKLFHLVVPSENGRCRLRFLVKENTAQYEMKVLLWQSYGNRLYSFILRLNRAFWD